MSGSTAAVIVLPIVIALSLFTWLSLVFYADRHPGRGRYNTDLRAEVRGGSFQAVEGGRQLMPIPEHRPTVPMQRGADTPDADRASAGGATATATSAEADIRSAEADTRPMAAHRQT